MNLFKNPLKMRVLHQLFDGGLAGEFGFTIGNISKKKQSMFNQHGDFSQKTFDSSQLFQLVVSPG